MVLTWQNTALGEDANIKIINIMPRCKFSQKNSRLMLELDWEIWNVAFFRNFPILNTFYPAFPFSSFLPACSSLFPLYNSKHPNCRNQESCRSTEQTSSRALASLHTLHFPNLTEPFITPENSSTQHRRPDRTSLSDQHVMYWCPT